MVTTRQTDSPVALALAPKANKKLSSIKPPTARPRRIQKFAVRKATTKFSKKGNSNSNSNSASNETVEVVKMLTGILYLYRGTNPRAEFVRKV